MNRDNHYEAAFEEFLRSRGVPYVAVDEAKRSLMSDGASIKSLDFIVSRRTDIPVCQAADRNVCPTPTAADRNVCPTPTAAGKNACPPAPTTWLVDVKGRRFPSGDVQKQYCKNLAEKHSVIALSEPLSPVCDSVFRPAARTGVHRTLVP
jgi:hypothetical protein